MAARLKAQARRAAPGRLAVGSARPAVLDAEAGMLADGRGAERSIGVIGRERLIDQALATMVAVESLGPGDQISLTNAQALVWAIYLRVIERHRGLASGREIAHSVQPAREAGISGEEI